MNVLTYGREGYEVRLLQYALFRAGLDVGKADGIFGRRTVRAVQRFQRERGLAPDGIAGKLTWAALFPYITGYTLHRIVPGDTFFQLARAFGTTVQAIQTANPTVGPNALTVGESLVIPLGMPVVTAEIPYSSLLHGLLVKGLAMRYPFLKVYEIGRSVMNTPILALSVGDGGKRVGYAGAHHANEWITAPILLRFLEEYAAAYASDGFVGGVSARELYASAALHLVPLVNPDGVDLVTEALSPADSFYAQAEALSRYYPSIPFPEGWKANIAGVDLNLQYPAGWNIARRIKFDQGFIRPGPRDYVGSEPLIAPESRAIAAWTQAQDFSLILSYHTQGQVIYWQYKNDEVPGARAIGEAFSRSSGYALEAPAYQSSHAGYKDYFIQNWHRPGFTIEAGRGKNPLPLAQFEEIYRDNLPILVEGIALAP